MCKYTSLCVCVCVCVQGLLGMKGDGGDTGEPGSRGLPGKQVSQQAPLYSELARERERPESYTL